MKKLLYIALPLVLLSCKGGSNNDDELLTETPETAKVIEQQKISAQNVFNSIPGPNELSNLVEQTGLDYDASLLNEPNDINKYTSDNFKALNLGIYGGDMVYTNVYEQSQESMLFLKCVNVLCRDLGIAGAFDDKTAERLEANKENKDSLLTIVSQSFTKADEFLRENQRPGTSSLMVAGGWIEGLYLSVKVVEQSKSKRIVQKMSQQKQSLRDLITLVENARLNAEAAFVLDDLKDLAATYEKIPDNTTMSDEVLAELSGKVIALRNKMIMK